MMPETPKNLAIELRRADQHGLRSLIALHGRQLRLREVRQILLNPYVTTDVIQELASLRSLLTVYQVRAALARHPRTSEILALQLIPDLFWRDLLAIGIDMRLRATVRRSAEDKLIKRLSRLATGEKIAIARRASPAVLTALRDDPSPAVIRALLDNQRLTEALLLPLAAKATARPQVLDVIAADPRWGRRYPIRLALCRNPQSPLRAVLPSLPDLRRQDLVAVLEVTELSSVVHRQARRCLAERTVAKAGGQARGAEDDHEGLYDKAR